jgi:histidine triad (HIT) family protein
MSENDCIFCKIVAGEAESEVVHDEEGVMAFMDIGAKAPVHVLVIPKEHVSSLQEVRRLPDDVAKRIFEVAQDARQEVFHLHAHVMGGRKMGMP